MNRRSFFQQLASGILVASAPTLFLPRIVKPKWKPVITPKQSELVIVTHLFYRDRFERYEDGKLTDMWGRMPPPIGLETNADPGVPIETRTYQFRRDFVEHGRVFPSEEFPNDCRFVKSVHDEICT